MPMKKKVEEVKEVKKPVAKAKAAAQKVVETYEYHWSDDQL
jgi:hypothetical protein